MTLFISFYVFIQSILIAVTLFYFKKVKPIVEPDDVWVKFWHWLIKSPNGWVMFVGSVLLSMILTAIAPLSYEIELYPDMEHNLFAHEYSSSVSISFFICIFLSGMSFLKGRWLPSIISIIPGLAIIAFLIFPSIIFSANISYVLGNNVRPLDVVIKAKAIFYVYKTSTKGHATWKGIPALIPEKIHNDSGGILFGIIPVGKDNFHKVIGFDEMKNHDCIGKIKNIRIQKDIEKIQTIRVQKSIAIKEAPGCLYDTTATYIVHLKGFKFKEHWYVKDYYLSSLDRP